MLDCAQPSFGPGLPGLQALRSEPLRSTSVALDVQTRLRPVVAPRVESLDDRKRGVAAFNLSHVQKVDGGRGRSGVRSSPPAVKSRDTPTTNIVKTRTFNSRINRHFWILSRRHRKLTTFTYCLNIKSLGGFGLPRQTPASNIFISCTSSIANPTLHSLDHLNTGRHRLKNPPIASATLAETCSAASISAHERPSSISGRSISQAPCHHLLVP